MLNLYAISDTYLTSLTIMHRLHGISGRSRSGSRNTNYSSQFIYLIVTEFLDAPRDGEPARADGREMKVHDGDGGAEGMGVDGLIESNWDQVTESFDDMGLNQQLLRGIYGYGFEKPSGKLVL